MSKCVLPEKPGGHQNRTILQTQEGSYEAETAGRFFLRFCLPFLSRHLTSPRYRRKRKRAEVASAQARKKFCKSRQDDTAGKSSRERQAPAPVCRSQSAVPVIRGIAHSSIRRRADHRTPAEPSAAEFSGMVSATAPLEQGIFAPCGSVLTWHK